MVGSGWAVRGYHVVKICEWQSAGVVRQDHLPDQWRFWLGGVECAGWPRSLNGN